MKGRITICLWPEDIKNAFTAREFIKMYGLKELLAEVYMNEIMKELDVDEVLDFIGDERIAQYLKQKQEIA
jgi:hypothetical protein